MTDRRPLDTTRTPHVDPAWAEAFLLELRMLDVSGQHIGAALADVESHCADSGESAADAFGDPVDYARELDLPRDDTRFTLRETAGLGAGLVGLFLTVYAAGAWAIREDVPVTVGLTTVVVVLTAALTLMVRNPEPVARAVVARPWLLVVANVAVVAAVLGMLLGLDATLLTLPPLLVGAVGIGLVVWHTVEALRTQAAGTLEDPVVGPDGPDGVGSLTSSTRMTRLAALGPWVTAIATSSSAG